MKYQKADFYHLIAVFSIFIIQFSILNSQDTWIRTYQPFGDYEMYFVEDIRICPDGGYAVIGSIWNEWEGNRGFMMKTDRAGNYEWANLDIVDFVSQPEPSGFVVLEDGSFITAGNNFAFGGHYLLKRYPNGNIEWTQQLDNDYSVQAIELTNDGNIVTTGGSTEGFINLQKFDFNGNLIWRGLYLPESFEYGRGFSVTHTSDEGYALTGYVYGENNNDVLVIKTDENGDSLWTWTYDGYDYLDRGNCIINDNQNNLIIGGRTTEQSRTIYTFLAKLNSIGDTLWTNNINNIAECFSLTQSSNENSFVAYSWGGSISSGTRLYKLDLNGEIIWNNQIQDTPGKGDRSVTLQMNEQYLCCGNEYWGNWITISKTDSTGQITIIEDYEIQSSTENLLCFPNPFKLSTKLYFNLHKPTNVEINIYNIKGQLVRNLINKFYKAGKHSIIFSAQELSSGIYFINLINNNRVNVVKKILIIK